MSLLRKLRDGIPISRKTFRKEIDKALQAQREHFDSCCAELNKQLAHVAFTVEHLGANLSRSDYLFALPTRANDVPVTAKLEADLGSASEVCLFVTHTADGFLKEHVADHIAALHAAGIATVLIVNADQPEAVTLDARIRPLLNGCWVRENRGFDFAAWSHAYSLIVLPAACERLFLVNDSIVGPLDLQAFEAMLTKIRRSNADLIGLTENLQPQPHLQSYFLVCSRRLILSGTFGNLMRSIVNMPTKFEVIAQYETQLTRYLRGHGFTCKALFEGEAAEALASNHTICAWRELIESGFPFVKMEVLRGLTSRPDIVPQRYFERAQR